MPILSHESGAITAVSPASPGWRVDAFAPSNSDFFGIPTPSHVVAWALVADEASPGGGVVEPVFVAGTRTWTPDQFRAAYGEALELRVVPA
ncbi:hypothetical protein [Streptomyces griseosporeus]